MNIINESGWRKIWCPACCREKRPSKRIVQWTSPQHALVCYFTTCEECSKAFLCAGSKVRAVLSDVMEARLIERYPKLLEKLPPGYAAGRPPESGSDTFDPDAPVALKLRLFTKTELLTDSEFASAWETNDSLALDRAIMLRYTNLNAWIRELMPREYELEREAMLLHNMGKAGLLEQVDEFEAAAEGANCRWIRVVSREHSVRSKTFVRLLAVNQGFTETTVVLSKRQFVEQVMMDERTQDMLKVQNAR